MDDQDAGVNLAEHDDGGGRAATDGLGEKLAIAQDVLAIVFGGKAEVELGWGSFWSIDGADAANPGAEAVAEPVELVQEWRSDELDAVAGGLGKCGCRAKFLRGFVLEGGATGNPSGFLSAIAYEAGSAEETINLFKLFELSGE